MREIMRKAWWRHLLIVLLVMAALLVLSLSMDLPDGTLALVLTALVVTGLPVLWVDWRAQEAAAEAESAFIVWLESLQRSLAEPGQDIPRQPPLVGSRLRAALQNFDRFLSAMADRNTSESRRLRAVIDSLPTGVMAMDAQGLLVLANPAAEDMFGFRFSRIEARPAAIAYKQPDIDEAVRTARESGQPQELELSVELDDQTRSLIVSVTPLEREGNWLGLLVVAHDVTSIREAEQMKADLVADISHELKTPVTSIQGYSETLLDQPDLETSTQQRFLQYIHDEAGRLGRLTHDLLELSRIESTGERLLDKEPVDLRQKVNQWQALARRRVQDRQLTIEAKVDPAVTDGDRDNTKDQQPLVIEADQRYLDTMINNLLENAIKYTPDGGRISLQVSVPADGWVRISVTDTGVGIPREALARVFHRFYRVSRDRNRQDGGTGLGLAIVKHVARAHGGVVGVDSDEGRGASFWVDLPASITKA